MRRSGAIILLLAAVWADFAVGADDQAAAENQPKIEWHEQVMDAWKKAQQDKRPLLVYVAMDGCAYCRKMEKDTLKDPQIAEWIDRGFIAAKMNGPKEPALLKRLKVQVYPTTVIISPENKVLASIPGYVAADQLSTQLELIANEHALASAKPQSSPATVTK